jgi:hypothetical protein
LLPYCETLHVETFLIENYRCTTVSNGHLVTIVQIFLFGQTWLMELAKEEMAAISALTIKMFK